VILYYATDGDESAPDPVEVASKDAQVDAKGRKVFQNTHFATIDDAWAHLLESCSIGENWGLEAIERAASESARAQMQFLQAATRGVKARQAFQTWKESRKP
jgi:hypothetical protein